MRLRTAFCGLWLMCLGLSNADDPKIVCYYDSHALDKFGYARLDPSEIDPNLCTHLVYAYVYISNDGKVLVSRQWVDLPDGGGGAGFQKLNALRKRNKKLKTLVGAYGEGRIFDTFIDTSLHLQFVENVVDFLIKYEFDGFDIVWQSPTSREGISDYKRNLVLLLKELSESFDEHKLILSIKLNGFEDYARKYYDIPQISKYVHYILLDTECHEPSDPTTGHSAPLYPAARETSGADRIRNINATVHYWLDRNAPAEKLILGTRFYGTSYILNNSAEHVPGSPASGPAQYDADSAGLVRYNEICRLISQNTWSTVWDEEQLVPYSYAGDRWISYDNVRSLTEKAEYVQAMGLGGVMAWSIDMDDRQGDCGERHLLLNTLNRQLRKRESSVVPESEASLSTGAKIVCYYRSSAIRNLAYQRMEPSEIDPSLCTHLIYEDVDITGNGDVLVLEPEIDLPDHNGKAGFQKFNALRKRNKRLKTLVSTRIRVEDSTYWRVAADTSLRSKYVKNVVEFVLRHEFDGFDIDWQYWRHRENSSNDVQNHVLLLRELRASFDERNLILSIAVRNFSVYTQFQNDIAQISSYVDFISLDIKYHEPLDSITGHSAPLYPAARETSILDRSRNVNATVHHWLDHGVPAEKLILGARLYGIDFVLNNSAQHLPGSRASEAYRLYLDTDIMDYNEICILTAQDAWSTDWDEEQRVPYSYAGNQWISYDNVRSLTEKAEYVQAMGLGGVTVWSIDMDDHWGECGERYPLLKTLNRVLREGDSSSVSSPTQAKVVCYYTNWVLHKVGNKGMEPSEIDLSLCTHLIYANVGITKNGDVRVSDPWADLPDNKGKAGFQKFNALRKRNEKLKTLVSTGGWKEGSADYLRIAADSSLRSKFVKNVVDFLLRYEFNGFNMLWEYIGSSKRSQDEMQNFVSLLKELRESFDERKFTLSIQVHGVEYDARKYFAIPQISKYVDFILLEMDLFEIVMTSHSASLYPAATKTSSTSTSLNINASVHYWLKYQEAPAEKLILGIKLHGTEYTLNNSTEHLPGSPSSSPVVPGSGSGYLEYSKICSLTSQDTSWTTVWDEEQRVPYTYSGNQWISYENAKSLTEKGEYAQAMGLGGVMVFAVHMDDHRGVCGERYPLLNALNRGLRQSSSSSGSTPAVPTSAEIADRIMSGSVLPSMDVKIVCYYKNWVITRFGYSRMNSSEIDLRLCTHLIYSFVSITEDGNVDIVNQWIELGDNKGKGSFQKLNALREKNKKLKILVSNRGAEKDFAKYSKVVADASLRSKYVKNVVDFVLRHEFDGFDIDWQNPSMTRLSRIDLGNFVLLLKELRARFDEHKLILSVKVEGAEWRAERYYDIPQISKYVDLILLQIQSHYQTNWTTGHSAPLFPAASEISGSDRSLNYHAAVNYWLNQGAPKEKLILGAKFDGISFVLRDNAEHAPGSPAGRYAESGLPGDIEYNEICKLTSEDGWTTVWDEEQLVPYSYAGTQWISYDNVRSLTEKAKYVQAMGLGGVMAWSIDMDDHRGECGERYPLLHALNRVLRESSSGSILKPEVATTSETDTAAEEDAKRTCATLSIRYVRHPQNCAKFWICQKIGDNDFNAVPFSCGDGLYFDTRNIICKSKISVSAKVVCDYGSSPLSKTGYLRMDLSEIDPGLCTHLIYSFVSITEDSDVGVVDQWVDLGDKKGEGSFQKLNAMREKNENLKILASSRSAEEDFAKYSKVIADASLRSKYVKNAVDFLLRHEFDGFNIYLIYPESNGRSPDHVENFVLLLKELRASFDEHELILSIKVAGSKVEAKSDYDIPQISEYVDFILLQIQIQSHKYTDLKTSHSAPLYPAAHETSGSDRSLNYHAAIHYWLNQGAPKEKLILGAKFYGTSFALNNSYEDALGSPVGLFAESGSRGQDIGYNGICRLISEDGWTTVWDEEQRVPHSYAGNRWISYDNVRSLTEKAKYVQAMGLGGVMAWSIDMDDHRGECGERYPLLHALNRVLRDCGSTSVPKPEVIITSRAAVAEDEDAKRTCATLSIKYVRHPENCAKFWICQKIRDNDYNAEPFFCGHGLYFDTKEIICKSEKLVQCS